MYRHCHCKRYLGKHPITGKDTWAFTIEDDEGFTADFIAEDTGYRSVDGVPIAGTVEPLMQLYEAHGRPVALNYVLYRKEKGPAKNVKCLDFPLWHKYKDEIKRLEEADAKAPEWGKLGKSVRIKHTSLFHWQKGIPVKPVEGRIVDYDKHGHPIWSNGLHQVAIGRVDLFANQDSDNTTTEEKDKDTEMSNPFKVGELVSKRNGTDRIDGVVKYCTCFGATKSGGNVCSSKKCPHNPKEYIWVEWPTDGKLLSYKPSELMSSDEKMIQIERERELSKQSAAVDDMGEPDKEEGFFDKMKGEGKEAAYRVAGTQMTKAVRTGICTALAKKGSSSDKIAAINEFLEGEFGAALISCGLGFALPKIPGIGDDNRAQKLAKEFRVQGYATVGNELIGTAMEHILPAITTALAALPKEEVASKARVAHKEEKRQIEEEHEEEQEVSLAKAMRA